MEDLNNQKSELNPEEKMPKKGFKKKNIIIGSIIVLILIILAIVRNQNFIVQFLKQKKHLLNHLMT